MTKIEFYRELKKIGFQRVITCEGEKTDYFYVDLPRIRVVVNKWNNKEYGFYVRDVKDDNRCNNLILKTYSKLDEKIIKFIKKFVKFLGEK